MCYYVGITGRAGRLVKETRDDPVLHKGSAMNAIMPTIIDNNLQSTVNNICFTCNCITYGVHAEQKL